MPRILLTTLLVLTALVLQVTVVNRLPLSAMPDFVLLVVIALSAIRGPVAGATIGFFAGLGADLLPPADHALGQHALVLCLVGFTAGRWGERWPLLTVAACAVGAPAFALAVSGLLGDPGIDMRTFEAVWPMAALVNLLAAPVVVWAVLKVCGPRPEKATAAAVPGWRRS
ncbi:rod shape-determining protein MreD [Herbidospora sp. NEAU-GS84]|uniref:Rod shape-determining protein MreD n=1 Tax=Herbidospora solisilvae TaxID=2696284 RepID=A0A7C9JRF4_9ACTN|nr:rod shape-determining protein MreD [Herbidospora solisilvae]NAS21199.1 rod shape-determining protein MreD [Herbidospora solisilvae]